MNKDVRLKVSSLQYELIKNSAESQGFKTISSYIRKRILSEDETSMILNKIYKILKNKR